MAVNIGREFDHIDVVVGQDTNRHYLKDTTARADIDEITQEIDGLDDLRANVDKHDNELKLKANVADVAGVAQKLDIALVGIQRTLAESAEDVQQLIETTSEYEHTLDTKVDRSDVAMIAQEIDSLRNDVDVLQNKADKIEVASVTAEVARHDADIEQLDARISDVQRVADEVAGKASIADIGGVAAGIDILSASVDRQMIMKADAVVVGDLAARIEENKVDIEQQMSAKKDIAPYTAEFGALAASSITTNLRIDNVDSAIAGLRLSDAAMEYTIATKVPKPASDADGQVGQVLGSNGDGTTAWVNPVTIDDDIVGEAVSSWMDDHPEATTTVQDGSITIEKLDPDVQRILENGANDFDAQVAIAAMGGLQNIQNPYFTDDELASDSTYRAMSSRLLEYSGYCSQTNGFAYMFFTDPHMIDGRSYTSSELIAKKKARFLRDLYNASSAQVLLCGGDWLNSYYSYDMLPMYLSRINKIMYQCAGPYGYTAVGNHDYGYNGTTLTSMLTQQQVSKLVFGGRPTYYIIDGGNTACYVFDSGGHDSKMSNDLWTQIDWFANSLLNNVHPHAFGLIHMIFFDVSDTQSEEYSYQYDSNTYALLTAISDNITRIATAFNKKESITLNSRTYNFANATGTFHFLIGGHLHGDYSFTLNNVPCVLTAAYIHDIVELCYADYNDNILHIMRSISGGKRHIPIIPSGQYKVPGT